MNDGLNKIAITGGSGFIGTNLVEFYSNKGYKIINIDIEKPRDDRQNEYWCKVDINSKEKLERTLKDFEPDYIVHLAARTDLEGKSLKDYETNINGVNNLLSVCSELIKLKRVIFASSKFVCANNYIPKDYTEYYPDTVYGASKVEGEKLVINSNLKEKEWVIVRPTSIWGPWFDVPYKGFFDKVKKGIYVHPKGIRSKKTYGFVGNTVYQIDKLLFSSEAGVNRNIFYLGDYEPIEIKAWADSISREFKVRDIFEIPVIALKIIAIAGDYLKAIGVKKVPYTTFRFNNILANIVFDLSDLNKVCGELPYSIQEGVTKTVKWMKANRC